MLLKESVNLFLSGAIMMACAGISLYFFKFWRKTVDRFFCAFAIAFALFSLERWILLFLPPQSEPRSLIYFIRLAAFLLIIVGVLDKNRSYSPEK